MIDLYWFWGLDVIREPFFHMPHKMWMIGSFSLN